MSDQGSIRFFREATGRDGRKRRTYGFRRRISRTGPRKIRGGAVSFNRLMIVSGILVADTVDFALKGLPGNWRWMLALGAVPGAAIATGMFFLPHTRASSAAPAESVYTTRSVVVGRVVSR